MFKLKGKVAIVTGGASGIGLSISQAFHKQGATVHVFELNSEEATKNLGAGFYIHQVDVSKQSQVNAVISEITHMGSIDILVNNAGIAHIGTVASTTEEDLDRIYEVNIKGVYNCVHAAIPYFLKQNSGNIINMCSIAADVGIKDRFAYSMSKGAVRTMTYQIAKDYIEHNIRCNSISPARVHTPFVDGYLQKNYPKRIDEMFENLSKTQPIGRMGKPEEIGALAVYLASDEASFVTGTDFPIDGGFIRLNTP